MKKGRLGIERWTVRGLDVDENGQKVGKRVEVVWTWR